jgi:hypothetical protein
MISNISNDDGYISGFAELPRLGKNITIILDSESKEDIAFAERQIALILDIPQKTYEQLCRHTIDYASDIVDYIGENLELYGKENSDEILIPAINKGDFSQLISDLDRWFSEKETTNIVNELQRKLKDNDTLTHERLLYLVGECILDLGYSEDNFHHVWPRVQKDLENDPLQIMKFIRLQNVRFNRLMDNGNEILAANFEFQCDWEPEHGLHWSIVGKNGVWVSDCSQGHDVELTSTDTEHYNQDGNYCFHKTMY